jgi:hypothetical protein
MSTTRLFSSSSSHLQDCEALLCQLNDLIAQAPKNGIDTPTPLERDIVNKCLQLEAAYQPQQYSTFESSVEKWNGFWRMLWTNYSPAGPSSGKLGPFVGDVFQDLQLSTTDEDSIARNLFRLDFPPIMGELTATPRLYDSTTVAITFQRVGTQIAGFFPLGPNIEFEKGKEVRLWQHIYVDDQYRILFARNADDGKSSSASDSRGYLYVMKRADHERF